MSEGTWTRDAELLRLRHGAPEDQSKLAALGETDSELAEQLAQWDRQDAALASLYNPIAAEPIPARFSALIAGVASEPRQSLRLAFRVAAVIMLVAFGAMGGWIAAHRHLAPVAASGDLVAEALRANSTFSVEVAHPVEVAATDKVHLAGWLSKRLNRKFTPPDFASTGFRLLGGRVLPHANGAAALLMYEDDAGRRITLYVAPAPKDTESALRFVRDETAQGFWWVDNQLGCALLGDIPRDTLHEISLSAYHQINDL